MRTSSTSSSVMIKFMKMVGEFEAMVVPARKTVYKIPAKVKSKNKIKSAVIISCVYINKVTLYLGFYKTSSCHLYSPKKEEGNVLLEDIIMNKLIYL